MSTSTKQTKKRKATEEIEYREREESSHTQRQIEREISEIDGKKTVREVETSTTDNQATTKCTILRYKENATKAMENIKITDPSQLIFRSQNARVCFKDVDSERNSFYEHYPRDASILNDANILNDALKTYYAAPFVDFTWKQIMDSDALRLTETDLGRILINKLVWNAAFYNVEELKHITHDQTAKLSLTSFNDSGEAVVRFEMESNDIDHQVVLKYTDPCLLLLIPDKKSQTKVRTFTACEATKTLQLL